MKLDKVMVLGGAGNIGSVISRELSASGRIKRLCVADTAAAKPAALAAELGKGASHVELDLTKRAQIDRAFKDWPVVFNATPYKFGEAVYEAALRGGNHYFDLGGVLTTPEQWKAVNARAKKSGSVMLFNCGATPGLTNLLAMHGARKLDRVKKIQIAFATFRPMGLSPGLLATVLDEFSPDNPERRVYEDGILKEMPPFARKRVVTFLPPVGPQRVFVVPHEETFALPSTIPGGVDEACVHGTWRPSQMKLLLTLHHLNLLDRRSLDVEGRDITPRKFTEALLARFPPKDPEHGFYFYLYVEVVGLRNGEEVRCRYRTQHPDWDNRTTAKMTGIPATLTCLAMGTKAKEKPGAYNPEQLCSLEDIRPGLKEYGVEIEETESPP